MLCQAKHFSYEISLEANAWYESLRVRRKINSSWKVTNSFQLKWWYLTRNLYCSGSEFTNSLPLESLYANFCFSALLFTPVLHPSLQNTMELKYRLQEIPCCHVSVKSVKYLHKHSLKHISLLDFNCFLKEKSQSNQRKMVAYSHFKRNVDTD